MSSPCFHCSSLRSCPHSLLTSSDGVGCHRIAPLPFSPCTVLTQHIPPLIPDLSSGDWPRWQLFLETHSCLISVVPFCCPGVLLHFSSQFLLHAYFILFSLKISNTFILCPAPSEDIIYVTEKLLMFPLTHLAVYMCGHILLSLHRRMLCP